MRLLAKLCAFFNRRGVEQELGRELTSHLALLEEQFERRGMSSEEARFAARRAFGSLELAKELHREERSILWLEQAWQDLRYGARSLWRTPGFTLVAVITLALGIGANTTLFTAYDAIALKPLPVADPGAVVRIKRWFSSGARGDIQYAFSYPEYAYCRGHNDVFGSLVAASGPVQTLAAVGDERENWEGALVSANYFASLGIGARLGRMFFEDDRAPVLVLSYGFWQRRFRGDSRVLASVIHIHGTPFTVVGVAPEEFTGTSLMPKVPDFWAPLSMQAQVTPGRAWLRDPGVRQLQMLARLKPGTTLGRAQAQAAALINQQAATQKESDRTVAIRLQHTAFFGGADDIQFLAVMAALMFVLGMVLLVACANLANMLLARGAVRRREIGVRLALGAGRGRLVRQLLTESILLSVLGGMAGLVLSIWTTKLLWMEINQLLAGPGAGIVLNLDISPDGRVLLYVLAVSVWTGILFGISPALQSTRLGLATTLKETPAAGRLSRSRLRTLLLGGQVAVCMVLLISAGLLLRGLVRSRSADPQFDSRHVFLLSGAFGGNEKAAAAAKSRLLERLRSIPELRSAALGDAPMTGTWTPPIVVGTLHARTLASAAGEEYFETLGIGLVRGRGINRQEAESGAAVAVISEATARRFWPGEDPVGRRFQLDTEFRGTLTEFEVIGIARDVRYANLTRIDPAHVYISANNPGRPRSLLFRARAGKRQAEAAVRAAVREVAPELVPSLSLVNLDEGPLKLERNLAQAYALFAVCMASLALLLAGVGIYGVMAYQVSQCTREIGLRAALGATPASVLRGVLARGLRPVFAGMVPGITAAAGLSWVAHRTLTFPGSTDFLYGVPFYDPATFLGVACFLATVAAAASAVPARRALRVDPIAALRSE